MRRHLGLHTSSPILPLLPTCSLPEAGRKYLYTGRNEQIRNPSTLKSLPESPILAHLCYNRHAHNTQLALPPAALIPEARHTHIVSGNKDRIGTSGIGHLVSLLSRTLHPFRWNLGIRLFPRREEFNRSAGWPSSMCWGDCHARSRLGVASGRLRAALPTV